MKSFIHFQSNFHKHFDEKVENGIMDEASDTKEQNIRKCIKDRGLTVRKGTTWKT